MSRIRSANCLPETWVRSLLHRLGYRFRKNVKSIQGKPDIVLKKHNTIIFVHGCYWRQHEGCKRSNIPKSNRECWEPKLKGNVQRDKLHAKALAKLGWRILVIWECEIKNLPKVREKLLLFLSEDIK